MNRLSRHRAPLALLLLLPLLANAMPLSGLVDTDPTMLMIGLGRNMQPGWVHATVDWLDPTIGGIVEPLARLAGQDWRHGIIPWWNPYSGVGMPLAAEMQAYAFFLPFVFLFQFHLGWLLLRIVLQWGCGVFTYALLLELGLGRGAAALGGALYLFCPIFFLSPHAASAPLPFLPLLLLGIEHAASAAAARRRLGWSLIVIATAYSVYAGFPETTYLDGVLAAIWSLWRFCTLPWPARPAFAGKLALGVAIALGLCAPLLVPFLEYLPNAYLGGHGGDVFGHAHIAAILAPLQIMPYLYGPFNTVPPPPLDTLFDGAGSYVRMPGWVGLPALAMALAAFARRGRQTRLRYVLLAWAVVWELRYIGCPPVMWLLDLLPGFASADTSRFSGPASNLVFAMLAAFAFDDGQRLGPLPWRRLGAVLGVLLALILASVLPVRHEIAAIWRALPHERLFALANLAGDALVLAVMTWQWRRPGRPRALLAALVAGPLLGFVFPQLSGLQNGTLDTAPIRYLQAHIGTARMLSLGQFDITFPAPYHIASINYLEMPAPLLFADYIHDHLFAGTDLNFYRGGAPGQLQALQENLPAYQAIGVRYIVTGPNASQFWSPSAAAGAPGPFNLAQALLPGAPDLTGSITPNLPFASIGQAAVMVGTYRGQARGSVSLTLCAAGQCRAGSADAGAAADDAPMNFTLNAPLTVPPGAAISYRIHHPTGAAIAVWLGPTPAGEAPGFTLFRGGPAAAVAPRLVFADDNASIFELPGAAPYASAANPACQITIATRQKILTDCPAPSTLIRREMYFPGWGAAIGGHAVPLRQHGLFQAVPIPAGRSEVQFFFQPPHIRAACAAALLALAVWGWLGWQPVKRRKRFFFEKKNQKTFG